MAILSLVWIENVRIYGHTRINFYMEWSLAINCVLYDVVISLLGSGTAGNIGYGGEVGELYRDKQEC